LCEGRETELAVGITARATGAEKALLLFPLLPLEFLRPIEFPPKLGCPIQSLVDASKLVMGSGEIGIHPQGGPIRVSRVLSPAQFIESLAQVHLSPSIFGILLDETQQDRQGLFRLLVHQVGVGHVILRLREMGVKLESFLQFRFRFPKPASSLICASTSATRMLSTLYSPAKQKLE